ncbi:MAG: hypothetical protein P1P85_03490 [Patescibacteria group bacterium]|nr:hypothetical protein [Patescibacteria group bacterium]
MEEKRGFVKIIIKKIKSKKNFAINFLVLIVFISVAIYSFVIVSPVEQDIPGYNELIENNISVYDNRINKNRNTIERLLENSQVDEIVIYRNLIKENIYKKREKDPFTKSY